MNDKLPFGTIVLLRFPYADTLTFKRRPALILLDSEDGDIVVCRITSKLYASEFDLFIPDWSICGLKLSSVIRTHKIATLEKTMVESVLGEIGDSQKRDVKRVVNKMFLS
jgi:mRNA interferase MazF